MAFSVLINDWNISIWLCKAIKKLNITSSWAESINTASISKKYIEEVEQGHKCSACKEHLMLFFQAPKK